MASVIDKPIQVDQYTLQVERGRFARVCVEIDLSMPVVGKICLRDHSYQVEYEGLHLICAKCGCYGHMTRDCSSTTTPRLPDVQPEKNKDVLPLQDPPQAPKRDSNPKDIPTTGSATVLTPHISQVALGVVYDLEKETHGE